MQESGKPVTDMMGFTYQGKRGNYAITTNTKSEHFIRLDEYILFIVLKLL